MLMAHKNLVNVVWMRGITRQLVPKHLEDVFKSAGVVDVDVGLESLAVREEGQLQIPILI